MQTGQSNYPYPEMTDQQLEAYFLNMMKPDPEPIDQEEGTILVDILPLYYNFPCSAERAMSTIQRLLKTEKDKNVLASLDRLLTDLKTWQNSSRSTETRK